MFDFHVVSGQAIKSILDENPAMSIASVQDAYLAHHNAQTVNPDSYFLRFPHNPENRIIALPASIDADINVSGIKWIASFPNNIKNDIPRASAVLLLNDQTTGYPFACLEGSIISAVRTAASAVLGAYWINDCKRHITTVAFIGAGIIARNIFDMFVTDGWHFDGITIHDRDSRSMQSFINHAEACLSCAIQGEDELHNVIEADLIIFATNATEPYLLPPYCFRAGQIVLNISLRDIAPQLLLPAENIFDDVDHCLKAQTSPHLAEQLLGDRSFVLGTLAQLIQGKITINRDRPIVFSPFGMGILDLALGKFLYNEALRRGSAVKVNDFFAETQRW